MLRTPTRLLIAAGAVAALAACGGEPFAERDPRGYEACSDFAGLQKDTDIQNKMGGLFQVGDVARKASTKAIRDSVDAAFDEEAMKALEDTPSAGRNFFFVDSDKLEKACKAEGFDL